MKKEKKFLLFYFWGLSFSLLYYVSCSNVQNVPPPLPESEVKKIIEKDYGNRNPTVSLKKGVLALQVRTNPSEAGQFTIGISDSAGQIITPLLYNNPRGPWSYINISYIGKNIIPGLLTISAPGPWPDVIIAVDSTIFSNSENIVSGCPNKPLILYNAPQVNSDSTAISCIWKIDNVQIEQRLTLDTMGVLIQYLANDLDNKNHQFSLSLKLDTMINRNDEVAIAIDSNLVSLKNELLLEDDLVPEFFQTVPVDSTVGRGTLKVGNAEAPDQFIVGDWWHIREAIPWNYEPDSLYKDSAVMLNWNHIKINSGEPQVVAGIYYGLGEIIPGQNPSPPDVDVIIKPTVKDTFTLNITVVNENLCLAENITVGIQGLTHVRQDTQNQSLSTIDLEFQDRELFSQRVHFDSTIKKTDSLSYTIDVFFNDDKPRSFDRRIKVPNIKDSVEITLSIGNYREVPEEEITAIFKARPGMEERINITINNMVKNNRIDFKDLMEIFGIRFFPISYYKPFKNCPEWQKSYKNWIIDDHRSDEEKDLMLSDKNSPAALSYLFQQISKKIKSRLTELTESDSLTLIFIGTTDDAPVRGGGIKLSKAINCDGKNIKGRIANNKELACARAYFTMVEFMRYFADDQRIKSGHKHYRDTEKHRDNSIRTIIDMKWQKAEGLKELSKKRE